MARTGLYTVTLAGNVATVAIGAETYQYTFGVNPWDTTAWAHGVKQKIGDAGAIARDVETGRSATPAEKQARMQNVAARLASGGDWNERAEGGGGEGGLLYRALVELGGNPETVRAKLDGMSRTEQAALRANPRVAPVIERLRAKGTEGIDSDALLGEII